jgi:formate hydrogenlyase subunit 6/NADH:ubiquinone oxidoreductase subunit I
LPDVAREQWQPVYSAVQECFDACEKQAISRINDDITARKTELDQLVKQKESREIDRVAEVARLRQFEQDVVKESESIENIYQGFLAAEV